MILSDQLTRIRRFLRDPSSNIWSDAYLTNLYNDVQRDIQHKTHILEEVTTIRIPPMFQCSYLYDWEYQYLTGSKFFQAFTPYQQANMVVTYRWESQAIFNISGDAQDTGSHFTQPWEAWYSTPGELVEIGFPSNFHTAKLFLYDREPLPNSTLKMVQSCDSGWESQVGDPVCYLRPDDLKNTFVLYPRPETASWLDGITGTALFATNDTTQSEFGTITLRTGSMVESDTGLSVDVVAADDNVLIVFDVIPTELTSLDTSDYPIFLRKYIEYGVLTRAYSANTDGKIPSLANYWKQRYDAGIEAIKRFRGKRAQDRDYRLVTPGVPAKRTRRHPRLPDTYPSL